MAHPLAAEPLVVARRLRRSSCVTHGGESNTSMQTLNPRQSQNQPQDCLPSVPDTLGIAPNSRRMPNCEPDTRCNDEALPAIALGKSQHGAACIDVPSLDHPCYICVVGNVIWEHQEHKPH
eukprot:m.211627 g.211627  ORF g.211627 m.211627 type:complete len:121 (+) comp15066_c0_seq3:1486-1848(+)